MATAFDSFDSSGLGGFVQSALKARGPKPAGQTQALNFADSFISAPIATVNLYRLGVLIRNQVRAMPFTFIGRNTFADILFGSGLQKPYYLTGITGDLSSVEVAAGVYSGSRKLLIPASTTTRQVVFATVTFNLTATNSGGFYIAMTDSQTRTGSVNPLLASIRSTTGNYSNGDVLTVDLKIGF